MNVARKTHGNERGAAMVVRGAAMVVTVEAFETDESAVRKTRQRRLLQSKGVDSARGSARSRIILLS